MNRYQAVSRTFKYGIWCSLPLLVIYKIGLPYVNAGKQIWEINGVDMLFEKAATLFGLLPENGAAVTSLLMILTGVIIALRHEYKHFGVIECKPAFLFRTLAEALVFSLIIGPLVHLVCCGHLSHLPFSYGFSKTPPLDELLLLVTTRAGAGFYEELFWRVILLGGLLWLFKIAKLPRLPAQIIALTITALAFSGIHFISMFGLLPDDFFTPESFAKRALLGAIYGMIYLKRGFAGAAWTHTFANIWIDMNVL